MGALEALLAALASGDEAAAEEAAAALDQSGDDAAPAVLELLRSADADRRWWAVRVLAGQTAPQTEPLIQALRDPEGHIRAGAALALAAHPDAAAVPPLVNALGDEDGLVGLAAVHALVEIGSDAVPTLLKTFDQSTSRARINILRTLAQLKDHRAIPVMMAALDADSAASQYWAKEGLERLGLNMVYLRPD